MTTVVIIQARMGSTRLPGKVMAELQGRPVLAHVVERAREIKRADVVIIATGDSEPNRVIGGLALAYRVPTYYGPETDVLERFLCAATWAENVASGPIDEVVRITADCPLIDPEICDKVIELRRSEKAEYASNVWPRSFPTGLDCEVFAFDTLLRAHQCATDAYDREHVTPWMVRNCRRLNLPSGRFDLARHRWTLDYPEDLEFLRALHDAAPTPPRTMADVLAILELRPELARINQRQAA